MDATSRLASNIKSRNDLARLLVNAFGVHGALEPTHAVVDHGSNDRHVEGLGRHLGAIDDVVEELLAAARLAAGLVPGLAGRVSRERAAIGILRGKNSLEATRCQSCENRTGLKHLSKQ